MVSFILPEQDKYYSIRYNICKDKKKKGLEL